ncbi:MAG: type II toxin-antitoxin system Phd/YefM family antitoxin [Deltaproteobacteria bacterium]|nr:type II toxin-antitoxin system Phd/YefM family antitoxin [Deltaproteobacteria bacterium]
MKQVSVSEFKTHCLALLEDVARTGQPIVVVKRGKPLVRVTPSASVVMQHPQDTLRGLGKVVKDIDGPTSRASDWSADGANFGATPSRRRRRA